MLCLTNYNANCREVIVSLLLKISIVFIQFKVNHQQNFKSQKSVVHGCWLAKKHLPDKDLIWALFLLKEDESDDRRVLLAITVEIEDGSVEHIEMKEGDSAEAVATKFCLKHSLPDQFVAPLTEHIISNIMSIRSVASLLSDMTKQVSAT